jgi:hypothetical protein
MKDHDNTFTLRLEKEYSILSTSKTEVSKDMLQVHS